uniref:tachykinin-4 n=1 Tax=Jaculus jaculus TaxID=51337 RepID=UPI001E1B3984|nr:tachykinin-4 [Jaculus jaculus]
MPPSLFLLLLMGLSVRTAAGGRGKERAPSTEAEPWVAVALEGIAVPSIQLQLQEAKRSKTRQFFGLMGKQVGGIPAIQPGGRTEYQLGQTVQDLLSGRELSTKVGKSLYKMSNASW